MITCFPCALFHQSYYAGQPFSLSILLEAHILMTGLQVTLYEFYVNQTHWFKAECTTKNAGTAVAPPQSIVTFTKAAIYLSSVTLIA